MTRGSGTETTGQIQIGRVSERDHTRHHAIRADGHAACGRGKVLLHHVVPLTVTTARDVCRHRGCRKAIRTQLDAAQAALDLTAMSARRRLGERALIALADMFRGPATVARHNDLADRIRAAMAASGAYLPAAA